MNYCSIQDAWGKNNISTQYKEYMGNTINNSSNISNISNINNTSNTNNSNQDILISQLKHLNQEQISNLLNMVQSNDCMSCIQHSKTCKMCQVKFKNQYRSPIFDKINDFVNMNRDNIVLVLIVLFILVVFNLISNLNK
jgi:hypothetical protein